MKLHIVRDYDLEVKSVHLSLKAARDKLRDASLFVDTREYSVWPVVATVVCALAVCAMIVCGI